MLPYLVNRSMMWVCRTSPRRHDTPRSHTKPATTPPDPTTPAHTRAHDKPTPKHTRTHNPAYMRARARPISRARALPTNRHEGGSLT